MFEWFHPWDQIDSVLRVEIGIWVLLVVSGYTLACWRLWKLRVEARGMRGGARRTGRNGERSGRSGDPVRAEHGPRRPLFCQRSICGTGRNRFDPDWRQSAHAGEP